MEKPTQNFRIDKLSIRDYKGIDSLDLEFPRPKFPGDPDIFVIGSRNGLGKTSVLECCAWGLTSAAWGIASGFQLKEVGLGSVLLSSQVRLSQQNALTKLYFSGENNEQLFMASVNVDKQGAIAFSVNEDGELTSSSLANKLRAGEYFMGKLNTLPIPIPFLQYYENNILNCILDHLFLFFPDNRATQQGTVSLKDIQSKNDRISPLKIQVIQTIMGKSGILEGESQEESEASFDFLNNHVMSLFVDDAEISRQLKIDKDSSLDIRIRPKTKGESSTYSIDGLSSGQKEIISTLFLIWECTRNAPKVVLIDEPEQHLNAEWHRLFIHKLCEIAPWNQYIIATHSEYIMDAVDEDRRILLVSKE